MIAETLAVISAANAAIGQVKTMIGHGREISSMGKQLGAILTAEETLKAQGERKSNSIFSKAMGKYTNSFEEFLELDRLREARQELESQMRLYGRPGLYDAWVDFQRKDRIRKREMAEEQEAAKAMLIEIASWVAVAVITGLFCTGLVYWAYIYYG